MEGYTKISNIIVGVGTELIVHIHGVEARMKSSIVGIRPSEFMIIETPKVSGIETKLYDGNPITVIFMHSGIVYGFKSIIQNSVTRPARLLFIEYPENAERKELRNEYRVDCYLPAIAQLPGDNSSFSGIVLDISPGGCRYSTPEIPKKSRGLFQPGIDIVLKFQLLGLEGIWTFKGEIQGVTQTAEKVSLGVRFKDVDEKIASKIDEYVRTVAGFLPGLNPQE